VPRGERPLEPGDDVVVQFARDMRLLREKAGTPTYRELSARAHYSVAALSEAASGRKLPSLPVMAAYVAACGGDTAEWERRWRTTAAQLAATKADASSESDRAPYVGLAAFQPEDAGRFFGRDKLVEDLLARLRQRRFLGVFGSSGCGKSSLLRAGVVARLSAEREKDGAPIVVFTPGQHPVEECAVHLARFLGESPATLRDEFSTDPRNLHLRVRQAAADCAAESSVVLVVDQFEELFTLCGDERERARFVDALMIAATDPGSRTKVVLGVRADFLDHCGQYPQLVTALRDAQVLVGPMTTDELRQVATGPAEQAGYRVETALVARLVADAARQPGMLPLISHALLQTWRRRQGAVMTVAGYDAVGGIEHALARTAEEIYQALDTGQRDIAQQIFLRLTARGDATEDTRRRIPRDELGHDNPNTALVLDTLTRARLVTLGHNSVEIAHEALIQHWPRLRDWLADDREGHRLHRQLTEAATDWEHDERDEGLLYRGARLAAWQDRPTEQLNDTERTFLTASRHAAEREHRLRRRRVRLTIGGLSAATVVVAVLAVLALVMAVNADDERSLAVARQLAADARTQLQFDPELGLLLAREAYETLPTDDTEAALRQAAADSHLRATLREPVGPLGRPDPMIGVAFSPDGRHLATSGHSELKLWDWDTGKVTRTASRTLKGYAGASVFTVATSPDTRYVAEANASGLVYVWDWSGRAEEVTLVGHRDVVSSLAFSSDGRQVAGGGQDGTIRIWNASGDDEPVVLAGHDGPVLGVSFSRDGSRLASIGADDTLQVWDLLGGTSTIVLRGGENEFTAVAFSPDGSRVATARSDGAVHLWDPTSEAAPVLLGSHAGSAESVVYSPDGHSIASTGVDGTVRIWNADHVATPVVLRGHRGIVRAAAFSPDGKLVASVGADSTVRVWDVDEVQDLTVLGGHQGSAWTIAPSPDGRRVASGGQDGTVRIWDVTGKRAPVVLSGGLGSPILQVTFAPDGGHLAAVDEHGSLLVWNTDDFASPTRVNLPSGPMGRVSFSPDGERLAVSVDGSVRIWTTTGTAVDELPYLPLAGTSAPSLPVAWSPDGHHIAAATMDGTVLFWDVRNRTAVMLPGQPGQIRSLAFSPDGTRLASAGDDGLVHLWNTVSTGSPTVLSGHQGGAWNATFTPNGRHLITSGNDATVRVWTVVGTGAPLVLDGFRAAVQAVALLPGDRYVTAHDDGTIRVWRCQACGPITEVLAYADQHVTRELTPQERQTYFPADP
jgi:WD40 repeat protein/energy-coupling factor transporter ATP-binding protein EcfA2